jgi:RNA polymerase sigma-70 factor (ECF subfamily)
VEVAGVSILPVENSGDGKRDDLSALDFDTFFAAEYRSLVGLASVLCGQRTLGEEVAQEALLSAYKHWPRIAAYEDPAGWTRRVVANLATSSWRRRAREARALLRIRRIRPAHVELTVADTEFWAEVRALPRRQAQCVALHYLEDRSIADIARVLDIAEPTVRVHLHAARHELAKRLHEQFEASDGEDGL